MMIYPFEQITVTQLCKGCGVNRKSFYYHFRDKYDVINWIFDTEMSNIIVDSSSLSGWVHLTCISNYFYENRYFYKRALEITGQNSFSEHFRDVMFQGVKKDYRSEIGSAEVTDFQLSFFTDAIVMAFHRWTQSKSCMMPDEFMRQLWQCAKVIQSITLESEGLTPMS